MIQLLPIRGLRSYRLYVIFILVHVILSSPVSMQLFTRFDGTDIDMISLKGTKSNHDGYAPPRWIPSSQRMVWWIHWILDEQMTIRESRQSKVIVLAIISTDMSSSLLDGIQVKFAFVAEQTIPWLIPRYDQQNRGISVRFQTIHYREFSEGPLLSPAMFLWFWWQEKLEEA